MNPWGGFANASRKTMERASATLSDEVDRRNGEDTMADATRADTEAMGATGNVSTGMTDTDRRDTERTTETDAGASPESPMERLPAGHGGEKTVQPGWFRQMLPYGEIYTLEWEPEVLFKLGKDVAEVVHRYVTGRVRREILKHTVMHTLLSAWALPAQAISVLGFIDGTWTIAIDRAEKAGHALADVLMVRQIGEEMHSVIL